MFGQVKTAYAIVELLDIDNRSCNDCGWHSPVIVKAWHLPFAPSLR